MFYTLCGVPDFRVLEVSPYLLGSVLGTPQVTPHVSHHLPLVAWTPSPHGVALDILIEQFVWVEIRAVARQKKEVNLPPMACQPSLHTPGHMHWMLVDDEKDFASRMTDQPLQEYDKYEGGELLVEDHEGQLSAVGDGGDQVAAEALPRPRDHRSFSSPSVGGAGLMVGPHPHLVAPINRGSLTSGVGPDGRILLGQPVPHRLGVPLVGPPKGFLWCETPTVEIPPHRPDGKPNAKSTDNEIPNRFARPECKRQLELVRTTVCNQTHDSGSLPWCQSNDRRSASRARPKTSHAFLPPKTVPPVDGLPGNAKDTCRFRLRHPLTNSIDHTMAKSVLGHGRQTSGILSFHTLKYRTYLSVCQIFYALISNTNLETLQIPLLSIVNTESLEYGVSFGKTIDSLPSRTLMS